MSWPALLASSEPCAECETVLRAGAPVLLVRGALIRPRYHSYAQRLLPLCLACARPHWPAVERDLDAEARRLARWYGPPPTPEGTVPDARAEVADARAVVDRLRRLADRLVLTHNEIPPQLLRRTHPAPSLLRASGRARYADLTERLRDLAGTVEELAGRAADTLTTAAELTAHDQRLRTVLDLARGGEGALLTAEADDAESRLPELTWHRAALSYHVTGCLTTARRAGRQLGRELLEERARFETFEIAHDPKPTPR